MTVKGGTTPACAACKYQRRKCSPNCPLAPYFPANQHKMFRNVHRLFGVSNVTRTLKNLASKEQKEDAMRSIIYEAEMRERFPVDGCCAVIAQLRHQLYLAYEEMHYVCTNLEACRDQLGINSSKAESMSLDNWLELIGPGSGSGSGSSNDAHGTENVAKQLLTLDLCTDTMNTNFAQMDTFGIPERNMIDFEAQHLLNGAFFDDRQSYNEAFESSPESSLEDEANMAEHGCRRREMRGGVVAEENGCRRELRTAAADFTLTNVN